MSITEARRRAIEEMVAASKRHLGAGISVPALESVKTELMKLCERRDLFSAHHYPLPTDGGIDSNYLIYEEEGGDFALYVNSSRPGQASRPHDHGGTWAVVAAVAGEETHRLFKPPTSETAMPELAATITVKPGCAVSLLPEGIHAIQASSDKPLLHLHLYGKGFAWQGQRREYDLEAGAVHQFRLEDLSWVIDLR